MRSFISRATRRTAPLALALALLPLAGLAPSAEAATGPVCASRTAPALAAKLSKDIDAALSGRSGTVSVALYDRRTGTGCSLGYDRHFDSASTVKVTVLATTLRRAQEQHRALTANEQRLITAMITQSDNDSTTALWTSLGSARVRAFLTLAGMTETTLDPDGHWGLTRITARDELKLLALLDSPNSVLTPASQSYALKQMAAVVPSQRWGTPAGAPAGVTVRVKNGWLSRSTLGWRVHSLGDFARGGSTYRLVVLTHGNATMDYGIGTIERVARAVHRDLN
ncbi:serine hydrolase [Streptacidiphilus griseoplanus]|uniref:serine hydrolase n=1 Tax=Peterkaempfera griseoplana TaxID=66896 RepID=UPI000A9444C6|nr:serine hydrolase [Peterkaempfera griseoplana]